MDLYHIVHSTIASWLGLEVPEERTTEQEQRKAILKCLLEREVFKYDEWKTYVSQVYDAGITSTQILMTSSDATLSGLPIPVAPLDRLRKFTKNLIEMSRKNTSNTYAQPLSTNMLVQNFQLIPQLTYLQYLTNVPIYDKDTEVTKAIRKLATVDYFSDGLSKLEALFLILYCQESGNRYESFYALVNRAMRERNDQLFLPMRPALYILDSCFHHLPTVQTVAWRGMNTPVDFEKFRVGSVVCFSGICSCSLEKDVTVPFMEIPPMSGEHKKTLFKLNIENALSIEKYSEFEIEKEVIVGFCSRWKVVSVSRNKEEMFSFGSYQCDNFIELQQIESEPLFDQNSRAKGLLLLSQINCSLLETPITTDVADFISDFTSQLDNRAKTILQEYLGEDWEEMSRCCRDYLVRNQKARENLLNFFTGVEGLREELESNMVDLTRGIIICENSKIYDAVHLLHLPNGNIRSVADFIEMGFSLDEADKLFYQDKHRQVLAHYYVSNNLKGTVHSPELFADLIKNIRLKHYIKRDGMILSLYGLTRMTVRGAKYGLNISEKKFCTLLSANIFGKGISYRAGWSDVIVATIVTTVQLGGYALQLWYGDITLKQFLKSICVSVIGVVAGCYAAAYGMMAGAILAAMLGGPVTATMVIGGIIGGAVGGCTAESLARRLLEHFFPDSDEEEINAQRKLYLNALSVFNCLPDSSIDTIRRSYYELAQANHPDKCDNKKSATEKFQSIVTAFEIVKNYHEVLKESCELLADGLTINGLSNDVIKEWKKRNTERMNTPKVKKAYFVVYRHVAFSTDKWKELRGWLDGDRQMTLEKPVLSLAAAK